MNRRLIQLQRHSLAAIAMLFIVALMSPTGAVAAPKCGTPPCGGGGGNGGNEPTDSGASYQIDVYFGGNADPDGTAVNVDGSGNESRPKIGNTDMVLDLDQMRAAMVLASGDDEDTFLCVFGGFMETKTDSELGEFGVTTAKRPKNNTTFTYITASFWNFTVNGSVYFLVFGPDGDASIGDGGELDDIIRDEDNWPPTESGDENSNFMSGNYLELQVINGPAKKGPCDGLEIKLDWIIVVTKEPV